MHRLHNHFYGTAVAETINAEKILTRARLTMPFHIEINMPSGCQTNDDDYTQMGYKHYSRCPFSKWATSLLTGKHRENRLWSI